MNYTMLYCYAAETSDMQCVQEIEWLP